VSAISAATVDVRLTSVVESNLILKSLGLGDLVPQFDANLRATNPHILHAGSTRNGFAIVEVSAVQVDVRFVMVGDVTRPGDSPTEEVAFCTPLGSRRVVC
jgi:hypothetical protein